MAKQRRDSLAPFTMRLQSRAQTFAFAQKCIVPEHIDGRKSIDTEKWTLGRYLLALADRGTLSYPLSVDHAPDSLSPDFFLRNANQECLGVEITEASTKEAHWKMIKVEHGTDDGDHLHPGTTRDEQGRLWVSLMFQALERKAAGLASGKWIAADAYEVVVYDNTLTSDVDIPRALLSLHIRLLTLQSGFRSISILTTRPSLLRCVGGHWRVLPIDPRVNDSPQCDLNRE
jgi:hypothetical protein